MILKVSFLCRQWGRSKGDTKMKFEMTEVNGSWYVKGFRASGKMYAHYRFATAERAQLWIDSEKAKFARANERRALKAQAKKAARAEMVNPFVVGDICSYSWGYDQTNIEFFQVIAITRATVTLHQIASESVKGSEGFMSDNRIPVKDAFLADEKPFTKTLQIYVAHDGTASDPRISMPHGSCDKWDGKPEYCSWYA